MVEQEGSTSRAPLPSALSEAWQVRETGWKTEKDQHDREILVYEKTADGEKQKVREEPLDIQVKDLLTLVVALEKDWRLSDRIDRDQGIQLTRRAYRKINWKNMRARGSWRPPGK